MLFFTGVEKNNDVARSVVLHKSNNVDSPAEVIRAEHRVNTLYKRERRKRKYTKVASEFCSGRKQETTKRAKQKCISIQKPGATTEIVDYDSCIPEKPGNVQQKCSKRCKKAKKTKNAKKK